MGIRVVKKTIGIKEGNNEKEYKHDTILDRIPADTNTTSGQVSPSTRTYQEGYLPYCFFSAYNLYSPRTFDFSHEVLNSQNLEPQIMVILKRDSDSILSSTSGEIDDTTCTTVVITIHHGLRHIISIVLIVYPILNRFENNSFSSSC